MEYRANKAQDGRKMQRKPYTKVANHIKPVTVRDSILSQLKYLEASLGKNTLSATELLKYYLRQEKIEADKHEAIMVRKRAHQSVEYYRLGSMWY
jgi:hypothetical protein